MLAYYQLGTTTTTYDITETITLLLADLEHEFRIFRNSIRLGTPVREHECHL